MPTSTFLKGLRHAIIVYCIISDQIIVCYTIWYYTSILDSIMIQHVIFYYILLYYIMLYQIIFQYNVCIVGMLTYTFSKEKGMPTSTLLREVGMPTSTFLKGLGYDMTPYYIISYIILHYNTVRLILLYAIIFCVFYVLLYYEMSYLLGCSLPPSLKIPPVWGCPPRPS